MDAIATCSTANGTSATASAFSSSIRTYVPGIVRARCSRRWLPPSGASGHGCRLANASCAGSIWFVDSKPPALRWPAPTRPRGCPGLPAAVRIGSSPIEIRIGAARLEAVADVAAPGTVVTRTESLRPRVIETRIACIGWRRLSRHAHIEISGRRCGRVTDRARGPSTRRALHLSVSTLEEQLVAMCAKATVRIRDSGALLTIRAGRRPPRASVFEHNDLDFVARARDARDAQLLDEGAAAPHRTRGTAWDACTSRRGSRRPSPVCAGTETKWPTRKCEPKPSRLRVVSRRLRQYEDAAAAWRRVGAYCCPRRLSNAKRMRRGVHLELV